MLALPGSAAIPVLAPVVAAVAPKAATLRKEKLLGVLNAMFNPYRRSASNICRASSVAQTILDSRGAIEQDPVFWITLIRAPSLKLSDRLRWEEESGYKQWVQDVRIIQYALPRPPPMQLRLATSNDAPRMGVATRQAENAFNPGYQQALDNNPQPSADNQVRDACVQFDEMEDLGFLAGLGRTFTTSADNAMRICKFRHEAFDSQSETECL